METEKNVENSNRSSCASQNLERSERFRFCSDLRNQMTKGDVAETTTLATTTIAATTTTPIATTTTEAVTTSTEAPTTSTVPETTTTQAVTTSSAAYITTLGVCTCVFHICRFTVLFCTSVIIGMFIHGCVQETGMNISSVRLI